VIDDFAGRILKELVGVEREGPAIAVTKPEQQDAAGHWTRPVLLERAAYLGKLAKYGDGSACETIKEYSQHRAMLSFRSRTSDVEVDEAFAHIFYVVDGSATLVSGAVEGAIEISQGEIQRAPAACGTRYQLRPGDIAHVPAGRPYQLVVAGEKAVTCLVFKVRETAQMEPAAR